MSHPGSPASLPKISIASVASVAISPPLLGSPQQRTVPAASSAAKAELVEEMWRTGTSKLHLVTRRMKVG
jgi:hypothetical protein